jgi:hypothetical protein
MLLRAQVIYGEAHSLINVWRVFTMQLGTHSTQSCHFSGASGRFFRKVRHEAAQKDEGRPLGAGLQKQASNRLKLHW